MAMFKAIFFDLDDTLLDTHLTYREALAETCSVAARRRAGLHAERLAEVYHEVSAAMWRSFDLGQMKDSAAEVRVRVWTEALRQLGIEDEAMVADLADHYGAGRQASYRLFPDVLSTLDRLHRRFHLGIITNGMTEIQRNKIQRLGIEPYFDTVLISQEVGCLKPDPRIFELALARVPCRPEEAVMIGDSPDRDVAGARAVGMHALWVRTGRPREERPGDRLESPDIQRMAHAIFDRLEELLPWLEQRTEGR
jgi:HAD superfamily hydrolase (TIGR02253 family)